MFELFLALGVCVLITKMANIDGRSGIIWGSITLALCVVALVIPLPFLRFLIVGVAVFTAMIVTKMLALSQ